jgi:hypothetical protein
MVLEGGVWYWSEVCGTGAWFMVMERGVSVVTGRRKMLNASEEKV